MQSIDEEEPSDHGGIEGSQNLEGSLNDIFVFENDELRKSQELGTLEEIAYQLERSVPLRNNR
eukprot:CAMPEP_0176177786 /NCGR_PEP_ID=MMETSP0120_2-20121206/91086_1 /TAXON_ID=160619 /ORGANISM="Kryptoperidinium foliaceum, Strain CCMP 1326" /LENGTH=62 /DNA_ID=CAMNT_0017515905 /DNA_START=35 /DNA_END=220 /DNA_ORIENTATION=+